MQQQQQRGLEVFVADPLRQAQQQIGAGFKALVANRSTLQVSSVMCVVMRVLSSWNGDVFVVGIVVSADGCAGAAVDSCFDLQTARRRAIQVTAATMTIVTCIIIVMLLRGCFVCCDAVYACEAVCADGAHQVPQEYGSGCRDCAVQVCRWRHA